ncbi:MAG: hypothetical protein JXR50_01615 [Prolixibacteraceae bacterium]|nr:hypothetical protein [Prolixibacteraceae bacterium]
MKYIFVTLFTLLIFINAIQSQEIGLQAASGITRLRNPGGYFGHQPLFSYGFNCFLNFDLSKRIFLSIEPGYIQKGIADYDHHYTHKFDILSMPVVMGFDFYKKLYFVIGVALDKPIKIRHKSDGQLIAQTKIENGREFPLIVGLRKTINPKINISLRYTHAFNYISRNIWTGEVADYNQSLHLVATYSLFNFK